MGSKIQVPFAMQEGNGSYTQNSSETLVNMYAEIVTSGRAQIVRRSRPGLEAVYAIVGEKRCIEKFGSLHYAVIGNTLYSFDGTTLTVLGTLFSDTGRCTMIQNDNGEIMVSDRTLAYYWNGSALGLTNLPPGVTCGTLAYLGGFGIFNDLNTGRFYITGLNDFSDVDALDFATAEAAPDGLVTVFVDHNELWLAGVHTTEIWQLSGAADFPFSPITNAVLERGCKAALSYVAEDNTLYFLGDDDVVYRADGYRPTRVSTNAIEDAIGRLSTFARESAYALTYTVRGHKFVTFTFPYELTIQFNIATGLWNRAKTWGYPVWNVVGAFGPPADYVLTDAGISRLNADLATDEGGIMQRLGRSAPGDNGGEPISVNMVHLDAEVGRAAIGVTGEVMMRFAPDGETFGNIRVRSLGLTGDYKRRVIWRSLGRGRRPTIEFSITDPVPFKVNAVNVTVS